MRRILPAILLVMLLVPGAARARGPAASPGHGRPAAHAASRVHPRRHAVRKARRCEKPVSPLEAEAVKVAELGWASKDPHDRAVALGILARVHGACETVRIAEGLKAQSPELRSAAALAAAEVGVEKAAARRAATALLGTKSGYLRVRAALALLRLGDGAGREALVHLALGAPKKAKGPPTVGFAVASYAAMRLSADARRAGRGALMALLGGQPDVDLMARAGLVRLGDRAQLAQLRGAAAAGQPTAIRLVGELGAKADLAAIRKGMGRSPQAHQAALQGLAALGDTGPLAAQMAGVDLGHVTHRSMLLLATASRARATRLLPRFQGLLAGGPLAMRLYAAYLVVRADHPGLP